jgi:ABC-type multidrug transport system ATPase subunit
MPKKQKIARAETVLLMLGLKDCADLPVGGALLKGISGGEKRRLSLAVQSKFPTHHSGETDGISD